jgi:hypothetical protein
MLFSIVIRAAIVHTVTYFLVGFAAFTLFHYQATLADPSTNFRPATDPLVRAGVLFQPIRGLLFGVVFYLLRSVLFQESTGWLITWVMLVAVGIFSTFAPAGGSIEGFIYFKPTSGRNWGGLVEILTQSLLLSVLTYVWVNHPNSLWMSWMFGILFGVTLLLPALGLRASRSKPAGESPLQPTQQHS